MAEVNGMPDDSAKTRADAFALAEQAEAEATEAEALSAAAHARAKAIRLRQAARATAESEDPLDRGDEGSPQQPDDSAAVQIDERASAEGLDSQAAADDATKTGGDTEAGQSGEPAAAGSPPDVRRRWLSAPRASTVVTVAAVAIICGLLGLSGFMAWHHRGSVEQQQRATAFIAAAKQGVVNITSFDFAKAKADVQRVLDCSTGEFRDDFQKRAADFTSAVEQSMVVTRGTVNSAGIESMGKDSAVVLVSATSHVIDRTGEGKQDPHAWRLKVTMARDGDRIKMSKVVFAL